MADQNRPEEELDISGSNPPPRPPKSDKAAAAEPPDDGHPTNKMDSSTADLSASIAPGMTNEEIVRQILSTPDEKMIPWEECWLPSHGIYYGWPDGMIKARAMGQVADKILATQRLAQTGQSMDYLFRECCQFPDAFDPLDLLLGDRVFLLYFLRGITHGHIYEFAVTCPNSDCESVSTHVYDLNELASTIVWAKPELGSEPFKVVLPYMSKAMKREIWVGVRFLRASDANEMLARRKARKKLFAKPGGIRTGRNRAADPRQQTVQNQQLDDAITENMEKIIVNVMGTGSVFEVRQFIQKMHAQDTAAIRDWLKENTPGIDTTVTLTCPDCSREFTVELPITESFFRPAKQ
jgi:hypothetical protein